MNKPLWLGLSAALLTCTGCFSAPAGTSAIQTPPAATVRALTPPPPPITPEMVTPASALRSVQMLQDELDREDQQNVLPSSSR